MQPHNVTPCGFAEAPFETVSLLGHPCHALTEKHAVAYIIKRCREGRGGWVATHNLDHLRRLVHDRGFADLCATASLRTADGKPLVWASQLQGTPLPERVAGSDMVWSLTDAAAKDGRSIFFLGGTEGTADKAAAVLQAKHPGLKIAGTYCPPFGFEKKPEEMAKIQAALQAANADIVYVALGSPKQEKLIGVLAPMFPKSWFLGIGISLSFVTGDVKRAPVWMQRTGLEWVHRMYQEPKRLARRYLTDGIPFAFRLLVGSARWRVTHPRLAGH